MRNAVDHGLEPESERAALDKARGTLFLCTRIERNELVIEIGDDGRGIAWERVAQKAHARGLPHECREDLVEALFVDGLTTLDEVSTYSGRGVGMSAARAACIEQGGVVLVSDRPHGGTCIQFRFPYYLGVGSAEQHQTEALAATA